MALPLIAPFGSWESPIKADSIVKEAVIFSDIKTGGKALYWTEIHPSEGGRHALVKYTEEGSFVELAKDISVRTRVHEYGGGAFCVEEETVYFSNDKDAQIYSLNGRGQVKKLTHIQNRRYADGCADKEGKTLYFICEEHKGEGRVDNFLISLSDTTCFTLDEGHDFYSCVRLSPNGKKISFITWDFPNMPWDGSTLWMAEIGEEGKLQHKRAVAGGKEESICQAEWSPEGDLHFISDRTGFSNLYRLKGENVECLYEASVDFGIPAWVFGRATYAFLEEGKIACLYSVKGVDHLGIIDTEKKTLEDLNLGLTFVHSLTWFNGKLYFVGATPQEPLTLRCYDPKTKTEEQIKPSCSISLGPEWISTFETLEFPSLDGKTGYAFYYPPKNPHFAAPSFEKPPVIVKCHGGPTARSYPFLSLEVQYWTSRGFGLLDVNYGGSSGFGREYLKRLEGNWGVLDVHDAISAAKTLVLQGRADERRLVIRGGSAGGYTTLCALAFHDVFAAGTSYFGVSDLELLYEEGHKFESKYTDILVAPYPEGIEVIRKRSPIYYIDQFSAPVLFLQGSEDTIVPPNQTLKIFEKLKTQGIPTGMLLFEGEGHGFRKSASIKQALEAELYFYIKSLKITPAPPFAETPIELCNFSL